MSHTLKHPPVGQHLVVTFPAPKVLLLRLNRPEALNAMTDDVSRGAVRRLTSSIAYKSALCSSKRTFAKSWIGRRTSRRFGSLWSRGRVEHSALVKVSFEFLRA